MKTTEQIDGYELETTTTDDKVVVRVLKDGE